MKRIMAGLAIVATLLAGGIAIAQTGPGASGGSPGGSATTLRKFQKDTLPLRDELAAKRAELEDEYAQAQPDDARIASLEKDIVDLQAKIRAAANRNGLRSWWSRDGRGMMSGWHDDWRGGPGSCGCW